ncbi:hypothetical protein BDW22DRAFT_1354613 [Trametopsis cervina]|nr:hypothetical protein BDW22DRAFT_1354613 [Trametopsis cervina]
MSLSAPSKWLADELATLLSTPHSSESAQMDGMSVEDDPVDLFTTRFNHVFIRHARGLVLGKEVDREQLKQTLLALQKRWNASDCRYDNCDLHRRIDGFHPEMGVKMEFTTSESDIHHTIVWEACVSKQRNGRPRIKTLLLDGDPELFQS